VFLLTVPGKFYWNNPSALLKEGDINQLRQNLIIALVGILLLLGGLEGFFRVVLDVRPQVERYQLHSQLDWEWTPGYDAVHNYHGVEYQLTINSHALRNEDVIIPKPPNTYRVIALGDSITAGPGVNLKDTFVKRLERLLQAESPTRPVEIVNAGTNDYGTAQELTWLQERGLSYEPDLVILNVYLNDSLIFRKHTPWMVVPVNFLSRRSAAYYYYRTALRKRLVAQAEMSPGFRFRFQEEWDSGAWKTDSEALTLLIQNANHDFGLAWQENGLVNINQGISQLMQIADEHQFEVLIVIFPVDVQVYTQVDTPLGLERPQNELVAYAQGQNIPVLDVLPLLRTHRTKELFFDRAHLTLEGHQIVAQAIFQVLHQHNFTLPFKQGYR
jgi:lysophospholipase L1-like esterase